MALVKLETDGGNVEPAVSPAVWKLRAAGVACRVDDIGGGVSAETGGGSIEVGTVTGEIGLHTGGGSIAIRHANGKVVAETGGGSVRIDSGAQGARIETGGGSIESPSVRRKSEGYHRRRQCGLKRCRRPGRD